MNIRFLAAALAVLALFAPIRADAGGKPVAILVNGFGDCCAHTMGTLIGGLRDLGVEFPAVEKRGLSGGKASDYVVPWNSFSGLDQGFQVSPDPMHYVQKAMAESGGSSSGGLAGALNSASGMASGTPDQGIVDKVMGMVRSGSDEKFVDEVSAYVNGLPADRPVILVGHSFGADSVMEVAPKINREILFLGALDPVGAGGQRRLNRSRKVPANVKYFYNRWQNTGMFPFDYVTNGTFKDCRATQKCDQGKVAKGTEHVDVPGNAKVQKEILDIVTALLKGGAPAKSSSGGSPMEGLKSKAMDKLFGR